MGVATEVKMEEGDWLWSLLKGRVQRTIECQHFQSLKTETR